MSKPLICDDAPLNDAPASYTAPNGEWHPLHDTLPMSIYELAPLVRTIGNVQQSQGRELDAIWQALGSLWDKVAPGEPKPW